MTRFSVLSLVALLSVGVAFAGGEIGGKAGVKGGEIGKEKTIAERKAEASKLEIRQEVREFGRLTGANEDLQRRIQARVEETKVVRNGAIDEAATAEARKNTYAFLVKAGEKWSEVREELRKAFDKGEMKEEYAKTRAEDLRILLRLVSIAEIGSSTYAQTVLLDSLNWTSVEARGRMAEVVRKVYQKMSGEGAERNLTRSFDEVFEEVAKELYGIEKDRLTSCKGALKG